MNRLLFADAVLQSACVALKMATDHVSLADAFWVAGHLDSRTLVPCLSIS